jgi:GntR family transcriptional regulator, rspAB operon transcriptional repressor
MLKIKTVVPIRNQVLTQLRAFILTSKISQGERLYEEKLAAEIGSSRTPVREALHVLEREGLVESIPRVGYVVKGLDQEEFDEIVEIRKAIESLAAIWASGKLTDSMLRDLRENVQRSRELIEQGHVEKFIDMDVKFHELISKASGRKRIYEMTQNLRNFMLFYRMTSSTESGVAQRALAAHEIIIEAVRSRNEEKIRQAIVAHLDQVKKDVLAHSLQKGEPRRKSEGAG